MEHRAKFWMIRYMENGDAGCHSHEKETTNQFVIMDFKFARAD